MNYQKINNNAYNIHFIKTDKFKKIRIKINFKEEVEKEKIAYRNMLSLILLESSRKYKTKRLLDIECEELYSASVGSNTTISGNYHLLSFNTVFLNEQYTEAGMNKKTFKFFADLITDPLVIDNGFDEDAFNNAKNYLMEDIKSYDDAPSRLAVSNLYNEMFKDSVVRLKSCGYMEDLVKITKENLYEYYKKMLKDNIVDIFIVGNFDEDEMKKMIEDNININTIKKKSKSHIINHTKFRKLVNYKKQEKNINQSILLFGFKLDNITEFERCYVLAVYNSILGGSPNSKLFREVREKHSLCYSISSTYSGINSYFLISAGIDRKDYDKSVSLIKEELKKMKNGQFKDEEIKEAKVSYIASLKEIEDTPSSMISIYEAHEYLNYGLMEEREENINKVTKEDIINLSKKLKLDTIYLLEGVKNED
jgi:predicted Zn-dependent peptidase